MHRVGVRDGLQNEKQIVSTEIKLELIDRLADAGLKTIEATSFVSPKWIPQVTKLADQTELMQKLTRRPGLHYPVLVPNMKGFEKAICLMCCRMSLRRKDCTGSHVKVAKALYDMGCYEISLGDTIGVQDSADALTPGASGNAATEDVVYMLHGLGLDTGVELSKLISAGEFICNSNDGLQSRASSSATSKDSGRVNFMLT
ncbi:putative Hydroxymethylglutaryl-CoA lyase, mitochondrial [Hypsibius exemplaris]|uniref:hydroxymethylglutaryl-CoA lyase n=1 Tax=Hypsibius exemplaris TaxID=2072580 RepID=A0A1W0WH51_HYPEX|nr:putative Hydroxymethylglutaryl-CoA lyase, mitochondrial [Hypsibius exemplaris]